MDVPLRAQELPSESELPGQKTAKPKELPGESQLPPGSTKTKSPDINTWRNTLPPESALPPSQEQNNRDSFEKANEEAAKAFADGDEPRSPEDRPWLRLRLGGPTAPLRQVEFSDDSKRIFAGGRDKALHVWQLRERDGDEAIWNYEDPVYWQVQRAGNGAIRTIVANKNFVAFAGKGASVSNGEIALIDPNTLAFDRLLFDLDKGHSSDIRALAASVDREQVASIDSNGRLIVWRKDRESGKWNAIVIREEDAKEIGVVLASELAKWRMRGNDIAAFDNGDVLFPELVQGFAKGKAAYWKLAKWNAETRSIETLASAIVNGNEKTHGGAITAIGCSKDGKRIVTADLADSANIFCWDTNRQNAPTTFKASAPVRCLAVSQSGRLFVAGTIAYKLKPALKIWQWNLGELPKLIGDLPQAGEVMACTISPNEKQIAFTVDDVVHVLQTDAINNASTVLRGTGQFPRKVAFSAEADDYRFAIASDETSQEGTPEFDWYFDPAKLNLKKIARNEASDKWIAANSKPTAWKCPATTDRVTGHVTWRVMIAGKQWCELPLDVNIDGMVSSLCWIASKANPEIPAALIVGTGGRGHVYVYRLSEKNGCELVRQYRGHAAAVVSTSYSPDRKYLLSASLDGTVRVWKMDNAFATKRGEKRDEERISLINKWGVSLEIVDKQLVVTEIVADGPINFRGVNKGDVIEKLDGLSKDRSKEVSWSSADEIRTKLLSATPREMLLFHTSRAGVARKVFALHPAWQPLASLCFDADREWAWWTPYGYYDASFNGHKMFGWQVNRGTESPPDYFRAAELKEELERPDVMEKLLETGSLRGSFGALNQPSPENLSERLQSSIRLAPKIAIQNPAADRLIRGDRVSIKATVSVPGGVEIVPPKAFANGVPALVRRKLGVREEGDLVIHDFVWNIELPDDPEIRFQVLVSTRNGLSAYAQRDARRVQSLVKKQRRVFLVAAGVNRYADSRVPKLDFATNNARSFSKLWSDSFSPRIGNKITLLTDDNVNPPLWRLTINDIAKQLEASARPDDVAIIFLSGHGVRDPQSGEYFYLTSEARYNDVLGRRYSDCISVEDLAAFAKAPCKKLLILDTCHSGAVQPLLQRNLKSIIRTLENDLFYTLTASEGTQEAFESRDERLGVFTSRLMEAIRSKPDSESTLADIVDYLQATVPLDSPDRNAAQFPTASPKELLRFLRIPN